MPVEKLPLVFHPAILDRFGEDLVSDRTIAISELVKNAYDADADIVTVEFRGLPERTLVISDNGNGMTLDEIAKGWLTVGTALKRGRSRSKKGRVFAGSMGIARWAAYSMCDLVEVTTSTGNGMASRFSISMPEWTRSEGLHNIEVRVETNPTEKSQKGTILTLSNMKWWPDQQELERLRMRLAFLCSPEASVDFSIRLGTNGKFERILPEQHLPKAPVEIRASVSDDGTAEIDIKANSSLYTGKKRIPDEGWHFVEQGKYSHLAGVKMYAFWYLRGERPGGSYWREGEDIVPGIRVYRDNIRVLPYGEPEFDWLELEETYTRGGAVKRNPRPMQLVGWILLSRERNSDLQDTAGREGLKDTVGWRELKDFGQTVFERVAEVRRILEPAVQKGKESKREDLDAVGRTLRKLEKQVRKMPELRDDFELVESFLRKYRDQSEVTALYRDRLTAGNLVNLVTHDVGVTLKPTMLFVNDARESKCNIASHDEALDAVSRLFLRIDGAYELLRGASRTGAYRVGSNVKVEDTIVPLVEHIRLVVGARPINIDCSCQKIRARMREADIWAVSANLLMNSVTCSEFEHARGRLFPESREVLFKVYHEESSLVFECEDNGPGLPDKPDGWIWEPFNSTRGKGGSGLGLFIVAQAAIWYGGEYGAMPSESFKSGAKFRIVLPAVVTYVQ